MSLDPLAQCRQSGSLPHTAKFQASLSGVEQTEHYPWIAACIQVPYKDFTHLTRIADYQLDNACRGIALGRAWPRTALLGWASQVQAPLGAAASWGENVAGVVCFGGSVIVLVDRTQS